MATPSAGRTRPNPLDDGTPSGGARIPAPPRSLGGAGAFLLRVAACLACAALLLAAARPDARADAPPAGTQPAVLILHTYNLGANRTDGLQRGINDALGEEAVPPRLIVEELDIARLGKSPDYQKVLNAKREEIAALTAATRPALAIVTDWSALAFWKANRQAMAPDIPMVACVIGDPTPWLLDIPNSLTVVERPSFRETVEQARRLNPGARKLLVLGSTAGYLAVLMEKLREDIAALPPELEVEMHMDASIVAMEERLKRLDGGWIVLAAGLPELDGRMLSSREASRRLAEASPVPVYTPWASWLGHGAAGGRLLFSEDQGRLAGRLALDILRGVNPADLPRCQEDAGRWAFDHAVLARFRLDERLLPPGSQVINRPVSFYETNKQLVWIYGLVTVLLVVVAGGLAFHNARMGKAQAALSAQVNLVGSLMEAMPTPMFYKDTAGVYLGCNRAFEEWSGLTRATLLGRTVHEVFPKGEADVFKEKDDALFAQGNVQLYEYVKPTPHGDRHIRFHKAVYRTGEGVPAGLVGVIADYTDIWTAEHELEKATAYLQALFDSTPSALICADADGRITRSNARAKALCQGCVPGAACGELPLLHDFQPHLRTAIEQERPVELPRLVERHNGAAVARDRMIYPLRAGDAREAVIRIDDVTESHRMQEMLAQSEKMMSVGGLAAGMAHEINNPLGGIMQSAQVVLTRIRPDLPVNRKAAEESGCAMECVRGYLERRDIPELLENLRESAKRAAAVVSNMLEFSKRSSSAWLPVPVNGLVDKALLLCLQDYSLTDRYDFNHIAVRKEYDPSDPAVPCSGPQIQQVVFNILRNAAQAMTDAATPDPTITLRTRSDERHAVIEIEDNGPGMDETARRKAFEPFYTTRPTGSGTGLGLSVSYFIVSENHGGQIELASEPGKGSRFTILLPRRDGPR